MDSFPCIKRAALTIAYDNNMINRDITEEAFLDCVAERVGPGAESIELALSVLTDEQNELLCCGEEAEQQYVLGLLPPEYRAGVSALLETIFEEV